MDIEHTRRICKYKCDRAAVVTRALFIEAAGAAVRRCSSK